MEYKHDLNASYKGEGPYKTSNYWEKLEGTEQNSDCAITLTNHHNHSTEQLVITVNNILLISVPSLLTEAWEYPDIDFRAWANIELAQKTEMKWQACYLTG